MELLDSNLAVPVRVAPVSASAAGAPPGRLSCQGCALAAFCVAGAAPDGSPGNRCVVRRRRLHRGERLFRAGDPHAGTLFTVRRGSFKTSVPYRYGGQQVTGFFLATESIGLESLTQARHPETAVALELSEVCEIAAGANTAARQEPAWLAGALRGAAARAIAREDAIALALRNTSAEQRLATFLLDLAQRHAPGGDATRTLRLAMSRVDIASFLGLTPETVSRLFSDLRRQQLLEVDRRALSLPDPVRLRALSRDGVMPAWRVAPDAAGVPA